MSGQETVAASSPRRERASALAGGMVLFGMGLVILARVLRPLPSGAHPVLVLLVGSLPNFGAGLGMPFAAGAAEAVLRQRPFRSSWRSFGWTCLGVLGVLVGWEYSSLVMWGLPIDVKDLLASVVGVALAALIHASAGGGRPSGVRTADQVERGRRTKR
jgi:hypothetical protein